MLNLAQVELLSALLEMGIKALDYEYKDGQYDSEAIGEYIFKLATTNPVLVLTAKEELIKLKESIKQ